jgi:hypothetical protein
MAAAIVWTALLTAACLVYPRRPRTAALLTVMLGVWTVVARLLQWSQPRSPIGFWPAMALGAFWCALGVTGLVKFRRASARAAHIGYWTAKE